MDIIKCTEKEYARLVNIWERSVKVSHAFLNDDMVAEIKSALIPAYFPNVDLYGIVLSDEIAGFIGLKDNKIEMLFIDDCHCRKGLGARLINYAKAHGAIMVDVNEQNTSALAFYKAQGFHIVSRDEYDDAGRPYPILHLSL